MQASYASQNKQQRIGCEENINQVCPSDGSDFKTSAEERQLLSRSLTAQNKSLSVSTKNIQKAKRG